MTSNKDNEVFDMVRKIIRRITHDVSLFVVVFGYGCYVNMLFTVMW